MHSKSRLVVLVFSLFSNSLAVADKADDFKDAATKTGCESIPYSDQRNQCRSQQAYVDEWCKGSRGPTSCTPNAKVTLINKQVTEYRELDELSNKRKEVEEKRARASDDSEKRKWTDALEDLDKKINESKRTLDQLAKEISSYKDRVHQTIDTLNKCIDYREAVMNVFSYSTDKVRGDASSDQALRPYAQTLLDEWAGEIKGHRKQIEEKQNAIETCKAERP